MRPALLILILASLIPAAAPGEVLFRDNFTGGKSSRWVQTNDGSGRGTFHVRNGAYVLSSQDAALDIPRALVEDVSSQNYFLQADVRIRPLSPGLSTASLLSYYTDSRHFYEFALDGGTQYWSLRKVDKSGAALLAQGPVPGSPRFAFHLGLYCHDGNLRAFIDGVMVADELDASALAGGAFGLAAQGAEAQWDVVVVRDSNPLDFFYAIQAKTTDNAGKVSFSGMQLSVLGDSARPVAGITVYRIRRDGLSYFVCQDPKTKYAPRSGFLSEFEQTSSNAYRIALRRIDSGAVTGHACQVFQRDWLLDFLRRTARLVPDRVSVDLQTTRRIHLRDSAFLDSGNAHLTDAAIANPGEPAELNQLIFGGWDDFGNYARFPSVTGRAGNSDALIGRAAGAAQAPRNSLFTLHVLRLSAGGPTVSLAWFVQEDSRSFVLVNSAELPAELQRGRSYNVPFTIFNSGENAGAFQFSVVLSRNSFPGATDIRLGQRSFSGLPAGGKIQSEVSIQVPGNLPDGRYFIATFLNPANSKDRVLRVHNGNFVRPILLGSFPASGRLTLTLNWSGSADLDLHVTDPFGETIYYFHPNSTSGGSISKDGECASRGRPEVVSYPDGSAASGTYQISIHYFRPCRNARDASWTLSVDSDKGTQNYSGVIHPGDYTRVADYTR